MTRSVSGANAASRLSSRFSRVRNLALLLCALALAPAAATLASAHEFKAGPLTIVHPWTRATPPRAEVGGGYLVVRNAGTEPDRLVSATAEAATKVEIHEMTMSDGVMKMRPVAGGIAIPAGGEAVLQPSGLHLMMMGLKQPLKEGESIPGSLTFERAGTVAVTFKVEAIGHQPDSGEHGATGH
ncbi:copper chaperone PCu(A)C [Rhizobiales bacterium L72]|uniref:Copper chaperone PCu(A)C n=1 Tax=Propylenella binzhouense TaxID=2555902 RepID=A0A964WTB4_9HYPH|nr:copper chaperone PCu(A)C [Propylenella binzhouense]